MTDSPGFPLHRMNQPQTQAWFTVPAWRRKFADFLVKQRYRGGFGVCSATLRLIAVVDPRGAVRELPPPHSRFEMWQVANKPRPRECPCAGFYDPEVGGAFRDRGAPEGEHHPLCQFDRTAVPVFAQAQRKAFDRLDIKIVEGVGVLPDKQTRRSAQERPDEWQQMRKEISGK